MIREQRFQLQERSSPALRTWLPDSGISMTYLLPDAAGDAEPQSEAP